MSTRAVAPGHYLIASDFDQTLSFNDSGLVLSELLGVSNFREKVAGLSDIHLVQQGAELAYLLRHDPEFRCVRREHLIETGKQVRLKKDIKRFVEWLDAGADEYHFSFYVISAAPRAVVQSALEGIVAPDHIYGAECEYDASSGEICAVTKVPAGYGKVAILEALATQLQISPDRTVYVGDGSSDIHVMLRVNSGNGFTIAVSEARPRGSGWLGRRADPAALRRPRAGLAGVGQGPHGLGNPAGVFAIGVVRWVIYGLAIDAVPVVVANLIVAGAALYSSFGHRRTAGSSEGPLNGPRSESAARPEASGVGGT